MKHDLLTFATAKGTANSAIIYDQESHFVLDMSVIVATRRRCGREQREKGKELC